MPSTRSLGDLVFARTEVTLALVIAVFVVIFSLASPVFFTLPNAFDLIESYAVTTVLAAGVFVVLVSRGIDISFAATTAATQYLAAFLAAQLGYPAIVALGAAALLGVALGCVNAVLTYFLRVESIIVTIATASIYFALLIVITDGSEIYNLPAWWTDRIVFLRYQLAPRESIRLTLPIVVMAVVVLATHLMMSRTRLGRQIYALGGNPEAAGRVGINILRVQLFVYGYLGFLSAVAGFLQAHRVGQAVPTAMAGTELTVLAVALLGGASLAGGIGTMAGVILGVLLLAILQNGLNLLGVSPFFFQVVIGMAILASMSFTAYAAHRRQRAAA